LPDVLLCGSIQRFENPISSNRDIPDNGFVLQKFVAGKQSTGFNTSFRRMFPTKRRPGIRRFRFFPEEDKLLKRLVIEFGSDDWDRIAAVVPNRNSRQCKDRWQNYLAKESRLKNPIPLNWPPMAQALEIDGQLNMRETRQISNHDGVISEQEVAQPTLLPSGDGNTPESTISTHHAQGPQPFQCDAECCFDEFLSLFENDNQMPDFDENQLDRA
jgi:hypothetical protein